MIITIYERVHKVMTKLEDAVMADRVELWDIEQFLSSNVHEHSFFDDVSRNSTIADIITRYNAIIDSVETDSSLRIEFDAN